MKGLAVCARVRGALVIEKITQNFPLSTERKEAEE